LAISILKELDQLSDDGPEGRLNTAFFLTYTLNLTFFEDLILPRLERIGINHIAILSDRAAYAFSLKDPFRPKRCGQSYVLGTSHQVIARQHAKMIWLHGDYDHVLIGSHNLTMSGFNDQLEITAVLSSNESSHRSAIRGVHNAVTELVQGNEHLRKVWAHVPSPIADDTPPSVYFFWNRHRGLLDQLSEAVGSVDQVEVVTPYLDADALLRLKQKMSAETMILDIPHAGTDSPLPDAVAKIPDLIARRVKSNVRLHAKSYSLTRGSDSWLALGSANCTNLGLIKSVEEGGNIEFLVLAPGALLDDPEDGLESIEDPTNFEDHTGRNWDEEEIPLEMVKIDAVEYAGQLLTVHWSETAFPLDSVTLLCLDKGYPCEQSPFVVKVDDPPSEVTLEVASDGQVGYCKAWVVHPEKLQDYATQARYRRMRDAISSDNPIDQANGIDAYFSQILRDLRAPISAESSVAPSQRTLGVAELGEAVGLIGFSLNIESISSASEALVSGNTSSDPLAALRGLVLRLSATVVPSSFQDEESVTRYQARRKQAKHRSVNRLIRHLNILGRDSVWLSSNREGVVLCLRDTLEATALIWHDIVRTQGEDTISQKILEAFLNFLKSCVSSEQSRAICSEVEISGPAVLAVGVAIGHAGQSDRVRLRQAIQGITPNPRVAFEVWRDTHPDRSNLLGVQADSTNRLSVWAQPVFHLFGELPGHINARRQTQWGTFMEIVDKRISGEGVPSELVSDAERLYGNSPIWKRYQRYGRISLVTEPICGCGVALSMRQRSQLERGDPVPCDYCRNIVMWQTS